MSKNQKGLALITFVELIVAIFLFITVINIGKKPAEAALGALFGSNLEGSFNEFVKEINKKESKPRESFIVLKPNTAIIGFSATSKEFRCIGCGSGSVTDRTSYFIRPQKDECNGKSCVCLCPEQLIVAKKESPYEMKCSKLQCKPINKNLVETVELKKYIEDLEKQQDLNYPTLRNAKWEGGFLFERDSRGDFVSNGLPQQQLNRFVVYLKNKKVNGVDYVEICPGPECGVSVQADQNKITSEECRVVNDCFKQPDIRLWGSKLISGKKEISCDKPVQIYNEDCERLQACVNSKIKVQSKCNNRGLYSEISFLP